MTVLEILTPKMLDFIEQKLNGDYAYQLLKQGKKAAQVLRELENISVFIEFNEDQDTVWGEFNPHKKQITLNANMDLLYEPWGVQSYDDVDDDFEWTDDVGYWKQLI